MNEQELAQLTLLFQQIASADRTPEYEYSSGKAAYLNANGVPPHPGSRWSMPREICRDYIVAIKRGTFDHELKRLIQEGAV